LTSMRLGNFAQRWKLRNSAAMAPCTVRTRTLRVSSPLGLSLPALVLALGGCAVFAPPTLITVLHTTQADRSLREEGKSLNIDHWVPDAAPAGIERGFFVVKSDLEWHQHWPDISADKVPVLPADFNFGKEMLLVVAPTDRDVVSTEVNSVIVNDSGIHVYLTETIPGVDCPSPEKEGKPNYDLARIPFIEGQTVQFHIESTPADACGSAPEAKITCRAEGAAGHQHGPFVDKLTVDPGTKVGCIVGKFTSPRPVIDLTWTFPSLPFGATTKMIVGTRGTGVTFTPDVFGTYSLQVEVLDDLQRRGTSSVDVEVTPKDPLVLQMIWTRFDPDDDPSTFPRIELHALALNPDGSVMGAPKTTFLRRPGKKLAADGVTELAPLPGTPGAPPIVWGPAGGCSLEGAEPYCKATAMGFTTIMSLVPSAATLFAVGVHFTDERVRGQAVACVRSYRGGKLVSDLCDTETRKANTWWQVGVFDEETAKTVETLAAERAQAAVKAKAEADAQVAAVAKAAAEAKAAADAKALAAVRAAAAARAAAPPATAKPAVSAAPSSAAPLRPSSR
jgi:hypothetical protein